MCSAPFENCAKPERLFFALWPDDALRQQIKIHGKSILQHTAGRAMPGDNLHITLAFLGNVDAEQRPCIETMAAAIRGSQFELCLDRLGHWPRPQVLWAAPTQTPVALSTLAAVLHRGAADCGLRMDSRPYRPHLTLKRKLTQAPSVRVFGPVLWRAESFVLVRSTSLPQGVNYEVLGEWRLIAEK